MLTRSGPPTDLETVTTRPAVAIAHDYLTQRGGAERVVLALQQAFPVAPIHTSVYDREGTFPEFEWSRIVTGPLQRFGPVVDNPRLALPLHAPAMSRLAVDAEVTVCSSAGWAHGVRATGAKVLYVHNTARWLYQREEYLRGLPRHYGFGLAPLAPALLSRWDKRAAAEAEVVLVNSAVTRDRVREHWGRDAEILHPPPGLDAVGPRQPVAGIEPGYLLTVSRLLPYKRVDAVLGAAAQLPGTRLVVVGDGPDAKRLLEMAPPHTIFLDSVEDAELRWLYENAEALVTSAHDDFGLTPIEAMQFGTPVVAVDEGGFRETVVDGFNGVRFEGATPDGVRSGLRSLRARSWDRRVIELEGRFSRAAFTKRIRTVVDDVRLRLAPMPTVSFGRGGLVGAER